MLRVLRIIIFVLWKILFEKVLANIKVGISVPNREIKKKVAKFG